MLSVFWCLIAGLVVRTAQNPGFVGKKRILQLMQCPSNMCASHVKYALNACIHTKNAALILALRLNLHELVKEVNIDCTSAELVTGASVREE